MQPVKTAIYDLVRSIANAPDDVVVTEVQQSPMAFDVRVSPHDFELVLSKLNVIKTLAASFAGLAEREVLILHIGRSRNTMFTK